MHQFVAAAAAACLLVCASPARAQDLDSEVAATLERVIREQLRERGPVVLRRTLDRTRRAFGLGPFASVAPSFAIDGDGADVQVGGGIALYNYDIPLWPTPASVKEIIVARAIDVARRNLATRASGHQAAPPLEELERIARESWQQVLADLTAEVEPRRFEKPGFRLAVEVLHGVDRGSWDVRAGAAFGIGPVYAGVALSGQWDDGAALVIPFELSVPVLLTDGLRSPVADVFARYEYAATDRADRPDLVVVGARFALDVL